MNLKTSKEIELKAFLSVYFLELEIFMNLHIDELKEIKFQSEEANTDEFIKKYFKDLILKRTNIISTNIKKINIFNESEN